MKLNIKTLHSIDTEYSADSVEWCPHKSYSNYFVCGTYQLEENDSNTSTACNRKGRIYLYEFDKESHSLAEMDRIETAAILDMKWLVTSDVGQQPILAAADALGQVELYQLLENGKLKRISQTKVNTDYENLLTLSIDWGYLSEESTNKSPHLLASDSKGEISLLAFDNERSLEKIHTWPAHNFEAWICAFDKWNRNLVYTGGDDTFLHGYDLRTKSRTFLNKSHAAGVTCLLSHPKREHLLLTGSYDENVRTFDTRNFKSPTSEINLGGGIWRLKPDPVNHDLILTACMYHNFSVLKLDSTNNMVLAGEYNEHKSICYGADWCMDIEKDKSKSFIATCSFYDHKLCLSSVEKC